MLQRFDHDDDDDDEDDAVPFAFGKIRAGIGRRCQSERHLPRPPLVAVPPPSKASACAGEQEEGGAGAAAAAPPANEHDGADAPAPSGASTAKPGRTVPSATDVSRSGEHRGASDRASGGALGSSTSLFRAGKEAGPVQQSVLQYATSGPPREVAPGGDPTSLCSHKIATLLEAAMDSSAHSKTGTGEALRDSELKMAELREFTRSLSQRAIARRSFRRQGSSMSIASECGSVSNEGDAHAAKKKRRSRKITRSQSMIDVMPPASAPVPRREAIEYDFDDPAAGSRRTKDPDGVNPVRSPIKRSRSLRRSSSAMLSGHAASKSLHVQDPQRGRQTTTSPRFALEENRKSVQRSRSLQPKSRSDATVPEQDLPGERKPMRRSGSSESLSSHSHRSQLSLKRSDLVSVLSYNLDGSVPIEKPGSVTVMKKELDRPLPIRSLQRSESLQATNRPKLDPPGVVSSESYLPSSERPTEEKQTAVPSSVHAERASTREVNRSKSLQLMKRPHPAPTAATLPSSEIAKCKTAKSKRGQGSAAINLSLDDLERSSKSHSSCSSRTSCSTAGTTTSSSASNEDFDVEGVAAADGAM